jgi:hypothetical protein
MPRLRRFFPAVAPDEVTAALKSRARVVQSLGLLVVWAPHKLQLAIPQNVGRNAHYFLGYSESMPNFEKYLDLG